MMAEVQKPKNVAVANEINLFTSKVVSTEKKSIFGLTMRKTTRN
jgi:hypothetical protein